MVAAMGRRSSILTNGAAIKALRERSGISSGAMIERLRTEQHVKLHVDSLGKIERGARNTSPEIAKAIAGVLRVDMSAILAAPKEPEETPVSQSCPEANQVPA